MRYAIYFAGPPGDALMDLGNHWLGRDVFSGAALPQPIVTGIDRGKLAALTFEPRRYGFHGTLRAPFYLKEGVLERDLLQACQAFSAQVAPFPVKPFEVSRLGSFLALTSSGVDAQLESFASCCLHHFEAWRAPLAKADIDRRRKSGLSSRQNQYLERWGYPYVFDEFRFHMTLSGRLDDHHEADLLHKSARAHFSPVLGLERSCSSFGLFMEPERGAPFQVHTIFHLTGTEPPAQMAVRLEEVQ